jgi:hypothetical protein
MEPANGPKPQALRLSTISPKGYKGHPMTYCIFTRLVAFAALVGAVPLSSAAHAEYVRVEFNQGSVGRLPATFDDLMRRLERGPLQPYASQVPTFSTALHGNHGGDVGSVSFSDAQDYCDVYWYELPNATIAQAFVDEYMLSFSGYGAATPPFAERRDSVVIVVLSGTYGALYQQVIHSITGSSR